jgi:hypothetical protein
MKLFKIVGLIIVIFLIISVPIRIYFRDSYLGYIPWSKTKKLQWSNFRGKKPKNFTSSARTGCAYTYIEKLIGDSLEIAMGNYFMSMRSYVKNGKQSDHILNHEQGHFDITEIYVRRMRAYIRTWNGYNKDDYNAFLLAGQTTYFQIPLLSDTNEKLHMVQMQADKIFGT